MGSTKAVKSVDTNILVRLIADKGSEQAEIAQKIVSEGVHVPITVLLELGWTLGSIYRFGRAQLNAAFTELVNNEAIHIEDEPAIRAALDLHRQGADIADVFHLVAAKGTEAFVTFDKGVPEGTGLGVSVERV
jgi:predicted nucleic-acid-binding protein